MKTKITAAGADCHTFSHCQALKKQEMFHICVALDYKLKNLGNLIVGQMWLIKTKRLTRASMSEARACFCSLLLQSILILQVRHQCWCVIHCNSWILLFFIWQMTKKMTDSFRTSWKETLDCTFLNCNSCNWPMSFLFGLVCKFQFQSFRKSIVAKNFLCCSVFLPILFREISGQNDVEKDVPFVTPQDFQVTVFGEVFQCLFLVSVTCLLFLTFPTFNLQEWTCWFHSFCWLICSMFTAFPYTVTDLKKKSSHHNLLQLHSAWIWDIDDIDQQHIWCGGDLSAGCLRLFVPWLANDVFDGISDSLIWIAVVSVWFTLLQQRLPRSGT